MIENSQFFEKNVESLDSLSIGELKGNLDGHVKFVDLVRSFFHQ